MTEMIKVENLNKTFTLHLRGGIALPVLRNVSPCMAHRVRENPRCCGRSTATIARRPAIS